jgi:hypothetical protein
VAFWPVRLAGFALTAAAHAHRPGLSVPGRLAWLGDQPVGAVALTPPCRALLGCRSPDRCPGIVGAWQQHTARPTTAWTRQGGRRQAGRWDRCAGRCLDRLAVLRHRHRVPAAVLGGWLAFWDAVALAQAAHGGSSRASKLTERDRLVDQLPWRGDDWVLDVGCGRGLPSMRWPGWQVQAGPCAESPPAPPGRNLQARPCPETFNRFTIRSTAQRSHTQRQSSSRFQASP